MSANSQIAADFLTFTEKTIQGRLLLLSTFCLILLNNQRIHELKYVDFQDFTLVSCTLELDGGSHYACLRSS